MLGAGRDITQLFESYHKMEIVKYVIIRSYYISPTKELLLLLIRSYNIGVYCLYRVSQKYYVGELIDNEFPIFPERGYSTNL